MKTLSTLLKSLLIMSLLMQNAFGQRAMQVVRGKVVDQQTQAPLPGVNIILLGSDPILGISTDLNGNFRFEQIPVGKAGFKFSYIGYFEIIMNNLVVDAGKELVLNVKMQESVSMMQDLVISETSRSNDETVNEMATVSARGFNMEETMRYAGSRNDPARMAANFAGVSGSNDARNDIIIRGNSPMGLLWRLEGVNIPNPNHFAAVGTTGGPVSILNNNLLTNSEFYTGAFPATYGNAMSGVFDLSMRNGNNEKRENLAQIGFNGLEFGAEGPFKKGSEHSYLANYRYSVPAIIQELNLNTGTGDAVPYYQDLSFKLNFKLPKGTLSFFGIGGLSSIDLLGSTSEPADKESNLYNGSDLDIYNTSKTGVAGLKYLHLFNKNTYWTNAISVSYTNFGADVDTVFRDESFNVVGIQDYVINNVEELKYSWNSMFYHRFNARNALEGGVIMNVIDARMNREIEYAQEFGEGYNTINYSGIINLVQAYSSYQHRFSDSWILNAGLNYQNLLLNKTSESLEPRFGLRYNINAIQSINIAYGRHSQTQPSTSYFVETAHSDGTIALTNKNLGFTTGDHYVLSYQRKLSSDLKLVAEAYYQKLRNVPVEQRATNFSMLNAGADFVIPDTDSLVNEGNGYNRGIELTLEKYFSKSYYFLLTGSLFDSEYTASDRVERNTVFNGRYVFNALTGKEWQLGKRGNSISIDIKVTSAGNKRYIPIDLEASNAAGYAIYNNSLAYEPRYADYFRADVKAAFKMQGAKVTQEWVLDIQNITNHKNIFMERYDAYNKTIATSYQLGFWPMFQYRILF
ncbi:MAG: TonB-dependent receptor [Cyclobacteriaceae bacterium]|nr:TonB-dependent receptor [Cyclobacteriaceae bacterium]